MVLFFPELIFLALISHGFVQMHILFRAEKAALATAGAAESLTTSTLTIFSCLPWQLVYWTAIGWNPSLKIASHIHWVFLWLCLPPPPLWEYVQEGGKVTGRRGRYDTCEEPTIILINTGCFWQGISRVIFQYLLCNLNSYTFCVGVRIDSYVYGEWPGERNAKPQNSLNQGRGWGEM